MAKCSLSLEYLKVTEAMAKCNLSLNYSQKIFWLDWTNILVIIWKQTLQKVLNWIPRRIPSLKWSDWLYNK